jgi:hypothetical protein
MEYDYFEAMVKRVKLTTEEEQMILEKRKRQCICDICPTYEKCAGGAGWEKAFCTVGKSGCIVDDQGECLCSTCPLSREMDLRYAYYCLRGSENQQRIQDILGFK